MAKTLQTMSNEELVILIKRDICQWLKMGSWGAELLDEVIRRLESTEAAKLLNKAEDIMGDI